MEHQHIKVLDETNSKNRLRFASSRKRSLAATANVYRNAKRQAGTTSSGREALVHHPRESEFGPQKKEDSKTSTFTEELDIAMDRNPSEIFIRFHREVWPLVRSLPELLHHSERVIDLLLSYMLSPEDLSDTETSDEGYPNKRPRYVTNLATSDILHLLGVFAKDLRHEIHGFLHEKIMPRIIYDLLSQAPKPGIQETPMDVGFVEAAFRTLSYIFRYDSQMLLTEVPTDTQKTNDPPCLEPMRQYYGVTLAHRRELVRRLAAEAFAPLVRMSAHRSKHLKRVLRALAASQTSGRTQSDAVDGIARLFSEVARGASGMLHSKGTIAIQIVLDVLAGSLPESGRNCILDVGIELYAKLRSMLDDTGLHEALILLIEGCSRQIKRANEGSWVFLRLLMLVVSECRLPRNLCQKILDPIRLILEDVLTQKPVSSQDSHLRDTWIDLVVALWSALSDDEATAKALSPLLQTFWPYAIVEPSDPFVGRLVDSLFPNVKVDLLMSYLGSQILDSAAAMPNQYGSLQLLHALASLPSAMSHESDDLYSIDHAANITMQDDSKRRLLDAFLVTNNDNDDAKLLARIKVVVFLQAVRTDSREDVLRRDYRKIGKFLKSIVIARCSRGAELVKGDVAMMSAAIEAMARMSIFFLKNRHEVSSEIRKLLDELRPQALRMLRLEPSSLPVLKAAALLFEAYHSSETTLSDKTEEVNAIFDVIVPNLCCESHFVRLHSLFLLKLLPKRPFVVDHAELDFQGDLDEDVVDNPGIRDEIVLNGMCNVLETLYEIESTLPNLRNERHVCFLLDTIGVIAKTGRLPVVYAEAVASHLLGVFFIRFSSLWKASAAAFRGIATGHHEIAWPILQKQLRIIMERAPRHEDNTDNVDVVWSNLDLRKVFDSQLDLLTSRDRHPVFRTRSSNAGKYGEVSRFIPTDSLAVTENLWKVAGESPNLLVAKGSDFSSVFIRFMVHQFYPINPNDPNARELKLEQHIATAEGPAEESSAEFFDTRIILSRLTSMLKAFSVVTQPRQLRLDDTLLSVFTSLVGHWDCDIARLSFECVLRYRLPYVSPYSELLLRFFDKSGFRDALMNLREASETGVLLTDHKRNLAPLLARLLFGRLSAKSAGNKSAKDCPSARRNAAMSFMAAFAKSDDDIYPMIYLITRGYLPSDLCNISVENHKVHDRAAVLSALKSCRPADALQLPIQLHQGFLNNLGPMLANLQSKLSNYLPAFLCLTLAITKAYEVTFSLKSNDKTIEMTGPVFGEGASGAKGVRSLCYRRLADIYSSFSHQEEVSHRIGCLLDALKNSFPLLPSMVADADKPPSLLLLLKTLAQQKCIFPSLVAAPDCLPNLLRCFSTRSKPSVTCAVLDVIEVLVDGQGRNMSSDHIGLLLTQYESRMSHSVDDYPTWRRELDILLRLSEILDVVDKASASRNAVSISRVLIPFLHRRANNDDKLKVSGVLRHLSKFITETEAKEIIDLFNCLFGLHRNFPILSQIDLRRTVAETIFEIAKWYCSGYLTSAEVVLKLCKIDSKKMDEIEYDVVIETLSSLGDARSDESWSKIYDRGGNADPARIVPVIGCCFSFLLHDDGVVTRTALKALLKLTTDLSHQRLISGAGSVWSKFLEKNVMATVRCGLTSRDENVRSYFISLARCVIDQNSELASIHLHTELSQLIRNDQEDLDFFINIRHVQVHRRARALQRLRDIVNASDQCIFSPISVSSILLPLAIHPIYESQNKISESFALEGIATTRCLARLLPWNKYNSLLWTHLTQFERHPEQEKYLIGLICALIDAFHFDFGSDPDECVVARGLNRRIIPKIEDLLTKKVDGKGVFLRPTVAIALLKLFQKLPNDVFLNKLDKLLKMVCNELRNRDSNARDVARSALAKMVAVLDMKYLADVVRELALSLNEGYKVHVRTATLDSILSGIIQSDADGKFESKQRTEFLSAIPGILDLIQKDLFDEAQERRDAAGSRVRFVKEAQGTKGLNCLEMVACLVDAGPEVSQNCAVRRILLAPFLERLRNANVTSKVINIVKNSLTRIVAGLRKNSHISKHDAITFVRATLLDFISDSDLQAMLNTTNDGENSDEDGSFKPIHVSGSKRSSEQDNVSKATVTQWRPTMLHISQTGNDAKAKKKADEARQSKVLDGAGAPKLTGSMRRPLLYDGTIGNNVKTRIAVVFCLNLLAPMLKNTLSQPDLHSVMDTLAPILTACACRCRDTEIVLLSFRCLSCLMPLKLPKMSHCNRAIASKSLDLLLSSSGNQELLQASFNMLTLLLTVSEEDVAKCALPIDADHMPVLLSFLRESITGGDSCGRALGLLKAILGHRFISVELYDVMDVVLDQTVRSPKESIRSQASVIFLFFLINYPLGTNKIVTYLKRLVANINYDFSQGRLSAIALVTSMIERLPLDLLEERNSIFFIPLALQLTNDDVPECCKALQNCIGKFLNRLGFETLQGLFEYTKKWSNQPTDALQITSLHIFRFFLQQRQDFIKRKGRDIFLVETLSKLLLETSLNGEVRNLALDLFVDLYGVCKKKVDDDFKLWNALVKLTTNDDLDIRLKACTILDSHLGSIDAVQFMDVNTPTFLMQNGLLFQVGKAMCFLIDKNSEKETLKMTSLVVKILTWILTAMNAYPSLCNDPNEDKANDPTHWVLRRLSGIAKHKGIKRQAVFKCFAAFAVQCRDFVFDHIELMLEPLCRSETENNNEPEKSMYCGFEHGATAEVEPSGEAQLVKEVMSLLEEKCPDESLFLSALSNVKTRAHEKKEKRKVDLKSQAVTSPQVFAQKKVAKQQRENRRRKRNVDEFRSERGSKAKRRQF